MQVALTNAAFIEIKHIQLQSRVDIKTGLYKIKYGIKFIPYKMLSMKQRTFLHIIYAETKVILEKITKYFDE